MGTGINISTVSVPVPIAHGGAPAHTPARGTPPAEQTGTGTETGTGSPNLRTGTETVCLRNFRTGSGTAQNRLRVDAEFILNGYNDHGVRYDAVQTAMMVFSIRRDVNGYNNARIQR